MALNADQLYTLTALSYMGDHGSFLLNSVRDSDRLSLSELADLLESAANDPDTCKATFTGKQPTKEDVLAIVERIRGDDTLSSMEITAATRLETNGSEGACCFSAVAPNGETAVIFEGTDGPEEWADNFRAGYENPNPHLAGTEYEGSCLTDSQVAALRWYQSLKDSGAIDPDNPISVAGHSKGGNQAQLLTLFNGEIDTCANFDGQGFSDAFVAQYESYIAAHKHKITTYAEECDYVNIIMNSVSGETNYIKAGDVDDIFWHHSLFSMDPNNSLRSLTVQEQNAVVSTLKSFLNSYMRSNATGKAGAMEAVGYFLGHKENLGLEDILNVLSDGDQLFGLFEFAVYAVEYIGDKADTVLNSFLPGLTTMISVIKVLRNTDILGKRLAEWLLLDVIPEGVYKWLGERFGLSGDTVSKLLAAWRLLSSRSKLEISNDTKDRVIASAVSYKQAVLRVDTETLRDAALRLNRAADKLDSEADEAGQAAAFCDEHTIFAILQLTVNPLQTLVRRVLFDAIPSVKLFSSAKDLRQMAAKLRSVASTLNAIVELYEGTERGLMVS